MPSLTKLAHFLGSTISASIAVGVLGYAMSTEWARTTLECTTGGSSVFNGSAVITLELFAGNLLGFFCPSFGGLEKFQVIPKFTELDSDVPVALHGLVLCLLAICLLFSAGTILLSLYNCVSNPYETYMGPIGVYVCSSISTILSTVVLIVFVVNVNVTDIAEGLVESYAEGIAVDTRNKKSEMLLGYYLVIPYMALSLWTIVVIYMYQHAAYKQRREQQRPTEDAPKEIMMY